MMKKWIKKSDSLFGDFSNDLSFGINILDEETYIIGRFDEKLRKDGMCITFYQGKYATFGKYYQDHPIYPLVDVDKNGMVEIDLGKDGSANIYHLSLDTSTSSFIYFLRNKNGKMIQSAISYDGKSNTFSFIKANPDGSFGDSYKIERKFIPDRPIVCPEPLSFVDITDENKFEYSSEVNSFAMIENSSSESDPGIGVIEWSDGSYCVGGWRDNHRSGWQAYQIEGGTSHMIFFGNYAQYDGLVVRLIDGAVYIKSLKNDGKEYEDNSFMITFKDGSLSFTDINKEYRYDRHGHGVSIPDLGTIAFVEFSEDREQVSESDEYYYADKYFNSKKKEENKSSNLDPDDPENQIMSLIGQSDVKSQFVRIKAYLLKNESINNYTNMLFSGGPGTGKTTVAKILTKVLYKYNAIDRDQYNEISAKSLFSSFTGDSSGRVTEFYKKAKGGVALIDDAHYLDGLNNSGMKEALNTLSNIMENDRTTTFIFTDSKYNIESLYSNNLDIFQEKIRFKIVFKDFTKDELKEILFKRLIEKGYGITDDGMKSLLEVIYLSKSFGNDINASAALSILEEVIIAQNVRTAFDNDKNITKEDVDTYIKENDIAFIDPKTGGQSDARAKLDELIGLEHIKETIDDLIAYFSMNRGKKVDFHMSFTGNPGTGKTEVARILGKLLRQEGILPTNRFIEVTRKDLVGEYIGQSAIKTRDIIERSMGGVLYIDEAYSLGIGGERDFGHEVIAELLKAMEDRRGEFCVILSGYTNEMKRLFEINPGFHSRVKFNLEFQDYTDEELDKIARLFLNRDNYKMNDENIALLVKLVSSQRKLPNFANVRTLREYLSLIQIKQARRIRVSQSSEIDNRELTYDDVVMAIGKHRIEAILSEGKNNITKLDPDYLKELYKDYPNVPFIEYKDFVSEVVIAIRTKGESSGESSGFIVSDNGYCVTCAHCVKGASKIEVRRRIYHNKKRIDITYEADLVSIDEKNDVAIIKLRTDHEDDKFDYISLADKDYILPPLSKVYLLGYPFGVSRFDEMSINEGKVASYQKGKNGDPDQINLDIDAKGGNSGSLIVDAETSKVIGILTGASLQYHGETIEEIIFCRPISYVWSLLEKEIEEKK